MTVCTDVYVRPQTCSTVSIYPSQVHPGGGGGVRPSGPTITRGVHPRSRVLPDDDEVLIALALLNL